MEKLFFDVFPDLKVDPETRLEFEVARILKIATNSERTHLKIYLKSSHIIQKSMIFAMEKRIEEQLFVDTYIQVVIEERYELSGQYTLEALLEEYRESIVTELREISHLAANMFEQAECTIEEGNTLRIRLEEGVVAEGKKECILKLLQKIFEERFAFPVQLEICYCKKDHEENRKLEEDVLRHEIDEIFQRNAAETEKEAKAAKAAEEKGTGVAAKALDSREKAGRSGGETREFFGGNGYQKKGWKKKEGYRPHFPDAPDMVWGKSFDEEPISLDQIVTEMGEVVFRGKVINLETKEIRNEKTILIFAVTDFTDTITVKMFARNEMLPNLLADIKVGNFLLIKGVTNIDKYDGELTIGSVNGIKKIGDFTVSRKDLSPQKRVELHCHTKMSDMDGVSEVKDIVKRAHDWGQPAIAITDHGVVQAFPDDNKFIDKLLPDDPFKVIYGVEGYIVDDLKEIAVHAGDQTLDDTYIVFDIETTGLSAIKDKIIEIGAVKVEKGVITDHYSTFVNPGLPIPYKITKLTQIDDSMVKDARDITRVLPEFLEFVGDAVLVAHNASFDVGFIEQNCRYQDIVPDFVSVDTVALSRVLLPGLSKYQLHIVAKALDVSLENHHRAVEDAEATAEIFVKLIRMLKDRGITTLKGMNHFGEMTPEMIRKLKTYHVVILAKNLVGRNNLYKLISMSHLTYFGRRPRIPKSELSKHREGLIVGSACEAGELFQAILNQKSEETIARLAEFYDYYEIQPIGNNHFMIESEKHPDIHSEKDLQELNRKIIKLGEKFHKPVVGTCDVHFLDPEDEIYRRIIMFGKGFNDADDQPPLYLRTTEEMLAEFDYLGASKAKEIVIDNPNRIADMVEKISPINPDKCPPVIENSDQELREICYHKAHEMYGEKLPVPVQERLEKELNSIISNGYAVMYIIAQKLVWKSNDDGYLVGSRGSVGSSFVATMAGITEVNPLSPHYYCKECHYYDFDSEEVKAYAGKCGFDMPDRICPVCGARLVKAGFDIPFETFLGFKGDKEPDIDLNFSGDYQAKAHKYTEVLFGEGHTFKAGTTGTVADKMAYGYVKNYYDDHNIGKRRCEIDRIVQGCTGIRRSTGQHPGGIVVLPHGHDINEFTPIQHPANDMECGIITTHFDYHSIDHNLLKLDILGHDDPTMIRALEEYITSDAMENEYDRDHPFVATEIPLDDKQVLTLFHDTSALGIKPEDISGCPLGCLGIPEFGTDFVVQMVQEANPQSLSDLIRISGLSHGTNVWIGNAQELVKSGKATISTAICTRDDIMIYLINQGVDSALSFTIMESVRKGKGLKPEWEEAMKAQNVPDWYIWSCKQISYMFPKAHAAAYVMMAYRIAYCKINYPLAYYAAYFSIRADDFSYELMCQGKEQLAYHLQDYKNRKDSLSKKEQDTLKDMRIVEEMYARGFDFLPMDVYHSKAKKFCIVGNKLLPPFASIGGMGDKAAEAVEEAAKDGPYLSLDDFRQRTKVGKTMTDLMAKLGVLSDLPESNQLSLFDFAG